MFVVFQAVILQTSVLDSAFLFWFLEHSRTLNFLRRDSPFLTFVADCKTWKEKAKNSIRYLKIQSKFVKEIYM